MTLNKWTIQKYVLSKHWNFIFMVDLIYSF